MLLLIDIPSTCIRIIEIALDESLMAGKMLLIATHREKVGRCNFHRFLEDLKQVTTLFFNY